jgi:hypothetical protein
MTGDVTCSAQPSPTYAGLQTSKHHYRKVAVQPLQKQRAPTVSTTFSTTFVTFGGIPVLPVTSCTAQTSCQTRQVQQYRSLNGNWARSCEHGCLFGAVLRGKGCMRNIACVLFLSFTILHNPDHSRAQFASTIEIGVAFCTDCARSIATPRAVLHG